MGIEKFFNSMAKNRHINTNNKNIVTGFDDVLDSDYLYIDFNSIIYTLANNFENDVNYLLYSIIDGEFDEKTIKISKTFNYKDNSIESFNNYFTNNKIDEIILDNIGKYIIHICKDYLNCSRLKYLYVAVDGVPQMSKVIEQKKRRYMGFVVSEIKNYVFNMKYIQDDLSQKRKSYEQHKKHFDRNKITPSNMFMDRVVELLSSKSYLNSVKNICQNITTINISSHDVFGEGEKKIVEDIMKNKFKGAYALFSPDADMIILGMILAMNNISSSFFILKYNQQTNQYDTIDISKLINNIYNFVGNTTGLKLNKSVVIMDIVFIFTLFGNDFVPKHDAIDVRNDVNTMMNIYCSIISKSNDKYLIYDKNNKYYINYDNLIKIINLIAIDEDNLLKLSYMNNTYQNFNFIRNVFGMYVDVNNNNDVCDGIKKYIDMTNIIYNKTSDNIDDIDDFIVKHNITPKFMKKFMLVEYNEKIEEYDVKNKFVRALNNINKHNKNIKHIMGLRLVPYDNDIDTPYHEKNIINSKIHPNMTITKYDKSMYALERKLNGWEGVLNGSNYGLGYVGINNDNNKYVLNMVPYEMAVKEYYEEFFENHDKNDVIDKYLEGLMWVFQSYFNQNNHEENIKNISTWFYPYHRAPLIRDIAQRCKNKNIEQIMSKYKQNIPRELYFTKKEHYMYIAPHHKHDDIQYEINNNIFPNVKDIAGIIMVKGGDRYIIDCRRISFLNKCNLTCIKTIDYNSFTKFIHGDK